LEGIHLSAGHRAAISPAAARLAFLIAVTAVAFMLRLRELGSASLGVDEALSVVFAAGPLPDLLRLTVLEDIHPPLHPLLLHLWMALAGTGEVAARLPSVVFGAAIVPAIYLLGEQLERMARPDRARAVSLVGIVAAVIAATSAFYVGFSQEARNYTMVTLLGLASSYLLLRALPSSGWRLWSAYAVAMGAAMYTNYTAGLLLPFHLLFVAATRRSYAGAWRRWALVSLAGLVAYLPWLPFAVSQLFRISDYYPGTLQLDVALRTSVLVFVGGVGAGSSPAMLPALLGIALLTAGLVALLAVRSRRGSFQPGLFLLLYLLVPSVLLFAIAYDRPKFDPRYLMVMSPAFYLVLSWGIASLLDAALVRGTAVAIRAPLAIVGIAALAGTLAVSGSYGERAGQAHVGDGSAQVDRFGDYRELVAYLEEHAQPGDAVALMMNVYHPYVYYSKLDIPWYEMEPFDHFDGAIIRLNRIAERHQRIWFVLWQRQWADPADYVLHVMEAQSREVPLGRSFDGLGLRLFELTPGRPFSYYPELTNRADVYLGDGMLYLWDWNSSATSVEAGGAVRYDFHWIPQAAVGGKLKSKVLLLDGENHLWAAVDEVMVSSFYPTSQWKKDVILHDRHSLTVPVGVPPGSYQAHLLVYDENSMSDLVFALPSGEPAGTLFPLGSLEVTPAPESAYAGVGSGAMATWRLGDGQVDLVRARISRDVAKSGDLVELELLWRAPESVSGDYRLRLALLDAAGGVASEREAPLAGSYPAPAWRAGEPVLSRHWIDLPAGLAPGPYRVVVDVAPAGASGGLSARRHELFPLEVLDPALHPGRSSGEDRVAPLP
jgi:mannosyltransferase